MRLKILWFFLTVQLLSAGEIRVAVAANVSYAMDTLIAAFHKHYPDTKVAVQMASSGKLTAQIQNGAPYDLFMSADMKYPRALYETGEAITRPLVYAQGALALFSTKARDFAQGLAVLKAPQIKRIAIANPKTAPYGKAAAEALQKASLFQELKPRLIYGESVGQTVVYAMKAADIGIIAKSALFSPRMKHYREHTHWVTLDPALYTPIDQGIVMLKRAANKTEAAAFFAFIFSKEAAEIFTAYGYSLP